MAGLEGNRLKHLWVTDEAAVLGTQIGVDNLSLVDVDLPMLGGDRHVRNENRATLSGPNYMSPLCQLERTALDPLCDDVEQR